MQVWTVVVGLVLGFGCTWAQAQVWAVLGEPALADQAQLAFVPESVDAQQRTVVVARSGHREALHQEVLDLHPQATLPVERVIAQREYLCAQAKYHTPVAQYLAKQDQIVYEYDYRPHQNVRFRTQSVAVGNEAEQMLFKKVCAA